MAIQFKQIAIGVSLVAFSATASAGIMLGSGGYARSVQTMEMMKMVDANGDHKVSEAEFTSYYGWIHDALDTNKDGAVDEAEWVGTKGSSKISIATGGYSSSLRTLKMMNAMDTDGDHKVTKAEFVSFHEPAFHAMSKGGTEVDGKGWLSRITNN